MITKEKLTELIDLAHTATAESKVGKECAGAKCNGICSVTYMKILDALLEKEIIETESWKQ